MEHEFGNDHGGLSVGKKKFAMISICSFTVVAMVVAAMIGISKSNDDEFEPLATPSKSVITLCQPTDYKDTCQNSLNHAIGGTKDPQKLVQASFQVALAALNQALVNTSTLKSLETDVNVTSALDDCTELMSFAIEDLKFSSAKVGEVSVSELDQYMDDFKTWLSATITYQQSCLDGLQNASEAQDEMKKILARSSVLTSNGLAIVSELSTVLQDLSGISGGTTRGRRLLTNNGGGGGGGGDQFPSWLSEHKRRLLASPAAEIKADIVVAADGSGQSKTLADAVKNIPFNNNKTFIVHVKAGIYKEMLTITRSMTHILLMGDGPTKTKIVGDLSHEPGISILQSAAVTINGHYFMAKDIGIENKAGPSGHESVALKVQADMAVFYNCKIDGYQNTLMPHTYRQFYRDCTITGTVDMIFGDAAAVFQHCKIVVRKPLETQNCIITAQRRNETRQNTGFVFHNCIIKADKEYFPVRFKNKAYLGRPAREFARTVIMQSRIDDLIDPIGWINETEIGTKTGTFGEFNNIGKGADTENRVSWTSFKMLTADDAAGFAPGTFITGDLWIPGTDVPYEPGLLKLLD